jgi:primosomal protein N' (replication factor Y)
VVPELATFAVDDGFSYAVPDALTGVEIGSIVRVPLGGRKVRGYVVDIRTGARPDRPLKEIVGVSGDLSGFDARHLETLRWAALHYVAPVAALLPRSTPPNLPRLSRSAAEKKEGRSLEALPSSPRPEATTAAATGRRIRPQYLVRSRTDAETVAGLVGGVIEAGKSAMVVVPTVAEAESLAGGLSAFFGDRVSLATSSLPARRVTATWVRARVDPGTLTVGTREVAFWPIRDLGIALVVEEGRRGMKATQTPTLHVREILRRRAAIERFQLAFAGPVPTTETLAAGFDIHEEAGRVWPLVEVVDRSDEAPGSGLIGERVRRALSMVARKGGSAFVLVHRRGYAPAFRCISCREIRRCTVCGAAADRGDVCRRCGASHGACAECGGGRFEPLGAGVGRIVDDLRRTLGDSVGPVGESDRSVLVGTERDLPTAQQVDVAAAVDIDGVMLAPHYRASEDALRLVARLAGKVRPGSGNRCMVQTGMPDHEVIAALRSGHPMPFLRSELGHREGDGFPPMGELVAIDVREVPDGADAALRETVGAGVHGPAATPEGMRWLLQGSDLREAKIRLRGLVQRWRDAGARVRVDVDPIDL